MTSEQFIARIIQPEANASGTVMSQGTKVMVGDKEMSGVTKIVLTAEVNDLWRAEIHCYAQSTDLSALAVVHRLSWVHRLKALLRAKAAR